MILYLLTEGYILVLIGNKTSSFHMKNSNNHWDLFFFFRQKTEKDRSATFCGTFSYHLFSVLKLKYDKITYKAKVLKLLKLSNLCFFTLAV